jgi:hypothetical protein
MRRRVSRRNPRCRIGVTLAPLEDFATHVAAFHRYRFAAYRAAEGWTEI